MEIREVIGDLLEGDSKIIVHQVNCMGEMNSGVAKAIRNKYPEVFEQYNRYIRSHTGRTSLMLGTCLLVPVNDGKIVANIFGQNFFGYDGERYTSYDAVCEGLEGLCSLLREPTTIGFPYKMSSDRGGADWDIILSIIKSVFKNTEHSITIYKLPQSL